MSHQSAKYYVNRGSRVKYKWLWQPHSTAALNWSKKQQGWGKTNLGIKDRIKTKHAWKREEDTVSGRLSLPLAQVTPLSTDQKWPY